MSDTTNKPTGIYVNTIGNEQKDQPAGTRKFRLSVQGEDILKFAKALAAHKTSAKVNVNVKLEERTGPTGVYVKGSFYVVEPGTSTGYNAGTGQKRTFQPRQTQAPARSPNVQAQSKVVRAAQPKATTEDDLEELSL